MYIFKHQHQHQRYEGRYDRRRGYHWSVEACSDRVLGAWWSVLRRNLVDVQSGHGRVEWITLTDGRGRRE